MMKPARSAAITLKSCWTEHARRRGGVRSDTAAEQVDCALSPCRGFFGAFCEFLCEQAEFAAAPGAAAPDETNLSCRIMAEQRPGNEVCALKQAGINSESRQQGGAETVVDICTNVGRLVASKPSVRRRSARRQTASAWSRRQ